MRSNNPNGRTLRYPLAKATGLTAFALSGASGAPQAELEAIARRLGLDPLTHRRWTPAEAERILTAWHAKNGKLLAKKRQGKRLS